MAARIATISSFSHGTVLSISILEHMLRCVLLFVILVSARSSAKVCVSGYVMDTLCLDRGRLLDNPNVVTLEQPNLHSLHCLVDVRACYESSFNMLVKNPSPSGTPYIVAYNLGHEATNAMLQRAREHGRKGPCSTCLNQTVGAQERGFRATVTGDITPDTMSSLGVPILSNVHIVGVGDVPCPQGQSATKTTAVPTTTGAQTRTTDVPTTTGAQTRTTDVPIASTTATATTATTVVQSTTASTQPRKKRNLFAC